MMNYQISASILSADFTRLGQEITNVMAAGAKAIHVDVMDNHYVPNLSMGPTICQDIHQAYPDLPLEVHLMAKPVEALIEPFARAGATTIIVHPETTYHLDRVLQNIASQACKVGLALNPTTSLDILNDTLSYLDLILIMAVNPGFSGQRFLPHALDKIKKVRARLEQQAKPIRLMVDGGITVDTIAAAAQAGADSFVSGAGIFKHTNYTQVLQAMYQQLSTHRTA